MYLNPLSYQTVGLDVCHEVPITLLKSQDMEKHYPPQISDPQVADSMHLPLSSHLVSQVKIEMAPAKSLRTVIDRMKVLQTTISLEVDLKQKCMVFGIGA